MQDAKAVVNSSLLGRITFIINSTQEVSRTQTTGCCWKQQYFRNFIIKAPNVPSDVKDKDDAIHKMAQMFSDEYISSYEDYIKGVYDREAELATGIGGSIAIPHGKCDAVKKAGLAIARFTNPIDWQAIDDEPVDLAFMIAVPTAESGTSHLKILTMIATRLGTSSEVEKVKSFTTKEQLLDYFRQMSN